MKRLSYISAAWYLAWYVWACRKDPKLWKLFVCVLLDRTGTS